MYGQIRVALDLPIPDSSLCTRSFTTILQSTSLSSDKAPKIVFPTVTVTLVGFSGYNNGTRNSKTLLTLGSLQSATAVVTIKPKITQNSPLNQLKTIEAT